MNIIILGPPGSGKGTQSKLLEKKWEIAQLSTGDMLRLNIQQGTELGKKAEKIIDYGELVSDEIILDMISNRINEDDCSKGFILDGFPRNIKQAKSLDLMLLEKQQQIDVVIALTVDKKVLFKRIENRAMESQGARADDNAEVLKKRIVIYEEQTKPIIPYYENNNLLHKVDGMENIDMIEKNINSLLESFNC